MSDCQPNKIRPCLYLSSLKTELSKTILDAYGITHILQVGVELQPSHPSAYHYMNLPLYDIVEQDIVGCFPEAFAFIEKAIAGGGIVLVHCQAGISRSASVVIGYCMWKDRLSAEAATQAVMRARSCIWPNAGFKRQLRDFQALGWDAGKWTGWSMQKYLSQQYGDESVGFMASMLGGAPVDRLRGASAPLPVVRTAVQQQDVAATTAPRAASAAAKVMPSDCGSGDSSASDCSSDDSTNSSVTITDSGGRCSHTHGRTSSSSKASSKCHRHTSSRDPLSMAAATAAAAAAGLTVLEGHHSYRSYRHHVRTQEPAGGTSSSMPRAAPIFIGEEAALLMAG